MSGSVIKKCLCKHEFQDQQYGKGMRVHNILKDGTPSCTVCQPGRRAQRLRSHANEWKPNK